MPAPVPTLSKEALKSNALAFANRWTGSHGEDADAKTFLDEFFRVFGRDRRALDAEFEYPLKRDGKGDGFIDLFWAGKLLVEMKSTGKDLDKAAKQAFDYIAEIEDPSEVPQWVMVSDFAHFVLYDLGEHPDELLNAFKVEKKRTGKIVAQFALADLPKNTGAFAFIRNEEQNYFRTETGVNQRAVKLLGRLHDSIKSDGFQGHALERFLVRILFCLFAEDTDIFPWNSFTGFVHASKRDGTNLGERLAKLFQTLDDPPERRGAALPETYRQFAYINGGLFREGLKFPSFTEKQRSDLLECCKFDWSQISPAVFGSLFQGVMLPKERREKGAHYTSEENIRKVIDPLFLDDLKAELEKLRTAAPTKGREKSLRDYQAKLAELRLLDPACGCGNFLVVAYRSLRLLELEALKLLYPLNRDGRRQAELDIGELVKVSVEQMFGIEIDEFPALIAETALWLTDHQVNMAVSKAFGQNFLRIPLRQTAHIRHGNALRIDWRELLPPKKCSYVLGNPPFVGGKYMSDEQAADRDTVFHDTKNAGLLDFVACWYRKAAEYIAANPAVRVAFVSTNSITQGEQVGVLWPDLFRRGVKIRFAHRTFKWVNDASGKAAVHCVIIGFGLEDPGDSRRIFDYPELTMKPIPRSARNINPYLVDADDIVVGGRESPLSPTIPKLGIGNKPIDGGNYLFSEEEKNAFIAEEPGSEKYFRHWIGADEFINGWHRYCLWLGDAEPGDLRRLPLVLDRIAKVRRFRLDSKSAGTRKIADTPTRFHVENMPAGHSLIIPEVSSEKREYVPIGFVGPDVLCSNRVKMGPDADIYHFGVMSSRMHMAWMRAVCGRLESRYLYSIGIVYNNYPWPEPNPKQRATVETTAQAVLDARSTHPVSSLADLYDPLTMPANLRKAHESLDRAVDAAYGYKGAPEDASRTAFLFKLYEKLTAPLASTSTSKSINRRS